MTYNVIGLMSGTSLDGLDMAYCTFEKQGQTWIYKVEIAETISYDSKLEGQLKNAMKMNAEEYCRFNVELGRYFGKCVKDFISKNSLKPDFISSHGHTIFHQPKNGFTVQAGDGAAIAAATGIDTVCEFRLQDVVLGGQGAPLVPIGDALLFSEFEYCLNLGGIANISFDDNGKRIAGDICFCNMALNYLANKKGLKYDDKGNLARSGNLIPHLLNQLNNLKFNFQPFPKSLGFEDFEKQVLPLIATTDFFIEDELKTVVKHISTQIKHSLMNGGKMLVTGGGALNEFLIEQLKESIDNVEVFVPDQLIVNYKEALIFAFLGVLRMRNEINVLKSVTGASNNSISGAAYKGTIQ